MKQVVQTINAVTTLPENITECDKMICEQCIFREFLSKDFKEIVCPYRMMLRHLTNCKVTTIE